MIHLKPYLSPFTLPAAVTIGRRRRTPAGRGSHCPYGLRPLRAAYPAAVRCLPAIACTRTALLVAACMRVAPLQLAAPAAGYAAVAAHALLQRRRHPRVAAPPSRRMRSVQSLTTEEAWLVAVQYFESIIKC